MNPDEICREIAGELRDIAGWLAAGRLDPEQFRRSVLAIEAAKLARFGFRLAAVNSPDGKTHFDLSFADSDEACAMMEYDPASGELTTHQMCD